MKNDNRAALAAQASAQDRVDAERYRWLVTHCRTTPEHWGGRWSIVIEGPVPEQPSDKAAIDAAIDAIRAKAGGAA